MNEAPLIVFSVGIVILFVLFVYLLTELESLRKDLKDLANYASKTECTLNERSATQEHLLRRMATVEAQVREQNSLLFAHGSTTSELKNDIARLFVLSKAQETEIIDANGIAISAKLEAEKAKHDTIAYNSRLYQLINELPLKRRGPKKRSLKKRFPLRRKKK